MYFLLCACADNLVFSLLAKGVLRFFAVARASLGANFIVALCEFLLSLVLIIMQLAGFIRAVLSASFCLLLS